MHREERAQAQRDRRAAEGPSYVERDNQDVIDYSTPGAGSKPPTFDLHARNERLVTHGEPVDYTKGGHDRPLGPEIRLDYSNLPAWIRHDRVRAEAAVCDQNRAQEPSANGIAVWEDMMQSRSDDSHMVDFSKPPDMSPPRGYDWLGRPYRRPKRWGS